MDNRSIEMERFTSAIELIRRRFPELQIEIDLEHPHVHATADIAEQPGIDFEVHINLQNCDELHLCAESLWASWFPVGEERVFENFTDAVLGLLSGEYRIVEQRLFGSLIKVRLQTPCGHEWQTIFTDSPLNPLALIPLPRTRRYIQNRAVR